MSAKSVLEIRAPTYFCLVLGSQCGDKLSAFHTVPSKALNTRFSRCKTDRCPISWHEGTGIIAFIRSRALRDI